MSSFLDGYVKTLVEGGYAETIPYYWREEDVEDCVGPALSPITDSLVGSVCSQQ